MPRQTLDGTTYARNTPPIPWGEPKYELKDCMCGAMQKDHDIYTLYVGAGSHGAWYARCKKCGRTIENAEEETAVKMWNRGDVGRQI